MNHKRGRRLFAFVTALLLVFGAGGARQAEAENNTAYGEGPVIYGEGYCVMDADSGDILCAKNAMGMFYPASITKTLTALVVAEHVSNFDDIITFSDSAVNGVDVHSSTIEPKPFVGEQMTVRNVMYGMMLASCNCCAQALAEYVAGSTEAFAELMNAKAAELGCTNSHFVNPHGLDSYQHYTNPYDMCLIARAAAANPVVASFMSTPIYTLPATNAYGATRTVTMSHKMVNGQDPFPGVYAGKTGRTPNAGRTLVTIAEHNGHRIICVLMKSTEEYFYIDAKILLEYAYNLLDGQEPINWIPCEEEMIATANCNLRLKPSVHAIVRGSLLETQRVLCVARYANWSRLLIDGQEYYCRSDFLMYPDGTPSPITTGPTEPGQETTAPPAETTTQAPPATEPVTEGTEEASGTEAPETSGTPEETASESERESRRTTEAEETEEETSRPSGTDRSGGGPGSKILLYGGIGIAVAALCTVGLLYIRVRQERRRRIRKSNRHRRRNRERR